MDFVVSHGVPLVALLVFITELGVPTGIPFEVALLLAGATAVHSLQGLVTAVAIVALADLAGTTTLFLIRRSGGAVGGARRRPRVWGGGGDGGGGGGGARGCPPPPQRRDRRRRTPLAAGPDAVHRDRRSVAFARPPVPRRGGAGGDPVGGQSARPR